jgi:acyl-coenzyme A thioesterase PaaI-like protein
MTRLCVCVVIASLAVLVPNYAQERSGRLLQVDFLALNQAGGHVRDLTPADVDLRIDGRRREVKALRRIAAAPAAAMMESGLDVPYGTSLDSASGRTLLLLVDQNSFRVGQEPPIRAAVTGLLKALGPADMLTVVGMPYGGVPVRSTNDHRLVQQAINSLVGQRSGDESGSDMACRTRLVLESVETLLGSFDNRTMPTTVVLFTAGLSAPRRDAPFARAPGMCELQSDLFRRVGVAAGAARANFYIAQPDDVAAPSGADRESLSGSDTVASSNPLAGIENLAGVTRGLRLPLTAQGTGALDRVARESSSYLVAEIEPQLSDFDPRGRRLDIRVTRPGVTVRARPEITFSRTSDRSTGARLTVSDMLLSAATFADLPLRAGAYTMSAPDGQVTVIAVGEPVDSGTTLASAGAGLVDDDGRLVARWSAVDAGELPLMGALRVPPGRYRLRVAAVDGSGRAGAADYRFDATLTPVGSLSLGSLVLGLSRDGQLTPRLEFSGEPSVLASFEIYGGVPGTAVTATLEIARSIDGPAIVSMPLAIQAQGDGRYLAMGTVPLGALAPGDYAVRGMLRLENGTSGRTLRTLRKTR